jgi:regulator of replication initiation timing
MRDLEAIREELQLVEEDLARLREAVADLRTRLGEGWNEPTDPEERTAMIEAAEEQDALISELETRREQLLQRLGER